MGKWMPVEEGIHSLRFNDKVDVSYIETGDWRAELLRDDEAVLTVYPPKTLALCRLVPDEAAQGVPVEVFEALYYAVTLSLQSLKRVAETEGAQGLEIAEREAPRMIAAKKWLEEMRGSHDE